MNCVEFRRTLGVDPQSNVVDFVRHRQDCARCADAAARASEFDATLRHALAINVPTSLADSILLAQATGELSRRRWVRRGLLALAAGVLLAVGIGMRSQAQPFSSLMVDHLNSESVLLGMTKPVSSADVKEAFAERGLDLPATPDGISFVGCCPVGRFESVHMVMPEADGPVTVMYIADHRVEERKDFDHDGWIGRTLPVGKGTLVLLARNAAHFDRLENVWRSTLQAATAHS